MKYLLTLLTTGRTVYLERTLASYAQHLTPPPAAIYAFDDGGTTPHLDDRILDFADSIGAGPVHHVDVSAHRLGQCAAQAHCWEAAASSDLDWCFHVEDDVVLLRPTDLSRLARCMDEPGNDHVAQMTLLRCPWGAEVEYGGYIPQTPSWYTRRESVERFEWIETDRNWANAPTLFRTDLARDVPWPAKPGCETKIGRLIRQRRPSYRFGLWGWGEPWVAHIGVERAPGSHGY